MATRTVRILSLFAGAGGLDLALDLALPGSRPVCYVEIDVPAARILAARFADGSLPEAPVWSNVSTFDGRRWRGAVDLIVGGFPCTDLSVAGKQAGIAEGTRSGLWFEYLRIIREVQPRWVFIENVPPVLSFPAGHTVLGGLAESGFDAEWLSLRASDVGAPHRRERVFVLAYRRGLEDSASRGWDAQSLQCSSAPAWNGSVDAIGSNAKLAHSPLRGLGVRGEPSGGGGLADGGDEVLGNARRQGAPCTGGQPQPSSNIDADWVASGDVADPGDGQFPQPRRGPQGRDGAGSAGADGVGLAHATEQRRFGRIDGEGERRNEAVSTEGGRPDGGIPLFPPGPSDAAAWRDILAQWPWLAPAVESGVRVLADGMAVVVDSARADQLRAGGNGVHAIQGALAFITLAQRAGIDFWGGQMSEQWCTPRTITGGAESAERKQELGRLASGGGDLQAQAAMWTPAVDRLSS